MRVAEMRESLKIINQCLNLLEPGLTRISNFKLTPPSRALMREDMEALINHFKYYSEGLVLPATYVYSATETPKGELGVYLVGNNKNFPYRVKIRSPGYFHLQGIEDLAYGALLADLVTIIGSMDIVFGEIDR